MRARDRDRHAARAARGRAPWPRIFPTATTTEYLYTPTSATPQYDGFKLRRTPSLPRESDAVETGRSGQGPQLHNVRDGICETSGPGNDSTMQTSQVTCLSCRRHLFAAALQRTRAHRPPQWQPRAPYSSAAPGTATTEFHATDDFIPSFEDLSTDMPRGPRDHTQAEPLRTSKPRYHRLMRRTTPNSTFRKTLAPHKNQASLEIFKNVIGQQADRDESAAAVAKDLSPATVQFYNDLNRLRPMMNEEDIETCFGFFMTKIWPNAPNAASNRLLKQRGTYLAKKVAEAKLANPDSDSLPSFAQITQLYQHLGSLSTTKWTDLIMGLISHVISKSSARGDYSSDEAYEKSMAQKEELLEDLVDSWVLFHRYRLGPSDSELQTSDEAEFRLPDINGARLRTYATRGDLMGAMDMLFFDLALQHREVPAVALATFVLLVDSTHSTVNARHRAKPLLSPIARILSEVEVRRPALVAMLDSRPAILTYVLTHWDKIVSGLRSTKVPDPVRHTRQKAQVKAAQVPKAAQVSKAVQVSKAGPADAQKSGTSKPWFSRRAIGDALAMGDVMALEAAWLAYETKFAQDTHRAENRETHQKSCNDFIMAFTALRRPQRAIDVWEFMNRSGFTPTLETWTSMMEGCRRAKNPRGLENIWKRLLASGMKPDSAAWTARIDGLMVCRQPEAGLRALSDMLHHYKRPNGVLAKTDAKELIPATNAAVGGLIRLNAMPAAKKVLLWASENSIEPDVVTYNTLLGPLVQQGDVEKVGALLKLMDENKVSPDGATWTILLDGFVNTTKATTPAEERQILEQLLAEMGGRGVMISMEMYARMIYLIVRDGRHTRHHTEGALGAVWDHMHAKGLRPSPHIYTILVEYYFAQSPPALADVNDLLAARGFNNGGGRLDRVFWERVIKGYALAGDVDKAFTLFNKVSNLGAGITLETLEALLRSLVGRRMMDEARTVVDKVREHRTSSQGEFADGEMVGGVMPVGTERSRGRYWNHGFWAFAHDQGLLSMADWRQLERAVPGTSQGMARNEGGP